MDELTTQMVRLPRVSRNTEAFLIVLQAPPEDTDTRPGMAFELSSYNTIGRLQTNKIAFNHVTVSREHCVIELRHDGYHIQDLASANGTVVDGKKLTESQLHRKESIALGDYRLLFWQGSLKDAHLQADLQTLGVFPLVGR